MNTQHKDSLVGIRNYGTMVPQHTDPEQIIVPPGNKRAPLAFVEQRTTTPIHGRKNFGLCTLILKDINQAEFYSRKH